MVETGFHFIGLDLGKSRDYSALAVVERTEVFLGERDPATFELRVERRYRIRYLERVRLGTPYPDVVERVRTVIGLVALQGRCLLVMDATGVGAPVLDMLRRATLGCGIVPVTRLLGRSVLRRMVAEAGPQLPHFVFWAHGRRP